MTPAEFTDARQSLPPPTRDRTRGPFPPHPSQAELGAMMQPPVSARTVSRWEHEDVPEHAAEAMQAMLTMAENIRSME